MRNRPMCRQMCRLCLTNEKGGRTIRSNPSFTNTIEQRLRSYGQCFASFGRKDTPMRLRVRATLLSFCLPSTANPHGANWPRVLVVAFASVCCVPLPAKASGNLQFGPPVHLVSNTPFSRPGGIALDETAKTPRLIVADTAHNTIQWADATDPTNLIFHSIPLANGFIDPEGLAVDTQGNLYVVNT